MRRGIYFGSALCALALALGPVQALADVQYDEAGNEIGVPIEWGDGGERHDLSIPPPGPGCMDANLQTTATATRSGGGAGIYGPEWANNGIFGTGNPPECCQSGSCWAWISAGIYPTTSWYALNWSSPVTICQIWVDTKPIATECGAGNNRGLHASDIQTWDGAAWVDQGSVTGQADDWEFRLPTCVTTTGLRLNRLGVVSSASQASNPILYELKVYGCGGTTPCRSPIVNNLTPTSGQTGAAACSVSQQFTATISQADAGVVRFTVTPPAGGTATPNQANVNYGTNATTVNSTHTLARPGLCGTANFTVEARANSACAPTQFSTRTVTYGLTDQTDPVLTAPPTATVECDSFVGSPPTSQTGDATVSDNCDANAAVSGYTDANVAPPPGTPVCAGNYDIRRTFSASDCSNNSTTADQLIQVRDTTAPTVTQPSVRPCLWPPNHHEVCFALTELADLFGLVIDDNCSDPATFDVFDCTSNQPTCNGAGKRAGPACHIEGETAADKRVCMRTERCGTEKTPREYSIQLAAVDQCGNSSLTSVVVEVPHDQRDHPECISTNR